MHSRLPLLMRIYCRCSCSTLPTMPPKTLKMVWKYQQTVCHPLAETWFLGSFFPELNIDLEPLSADHSEKYVWRKYANWIWRNPRRERIDCTPAVLVSKPSSNKCVTNRQTNEWTNELIDSPTLWGARTFLKKWKQILNYAVLRSISGQYIIGGWVQT